MAYNSDKKPGGLTQVTSLGDNDNVVVDQSGSVKRATLDQLESKIFDAKTGVSPVAGTEVVVVRKTDNTLGQVALSNVVPNGNITDAKISNSAAIADSKLATINTAGKVTNQAVQAVSTNTANRIVARDGSGNFSAGTITATLSGNASTATTAATATALATGRTIAMTGDVTYTSPSFNGTANVTAAATLANSGVVAGTYNNNASQVRPFTVDAKGRITSIGSAVDISINYWDLKNAPYKSSVTVATTGNLAATYNNGTNGVGATLTNSGAIGQLQIDGVSMFENARVLVKNQTNQNHNGIYTVTNEGSGSVAWVLTRAEDADTDQETRGSVVVVQRGTINGGQLFTTDFKSFADPGTAAQNWYQVVTTGNPEIVSTTMLQTNSVTDDKLRDSAALSVVGRSANSTGNPADIAAGTDGHVLRRSGTTLGFGQIVEAGIANNAVTNAKFRDSAGLSVVGRSSSTTGGVADITAATDGHALRRSGSSIAFGQITTAGIANSAVTTEKIANADVTFEKLALPSNFPIQVVQAVKTGTQTIDTDNTSWNDVSGLSITLSRRIASSSGAVRIQATIPCTSNNGNHGVAFRIVRGSTVIGVGNNGTSSRVEATSVGGYSGAYSIQPVYLDFIDNSPGSTATVTYKIQARMYNFGSNVGYINRSNTDPDTNNYVYRTIATLTVTELTP